MYYIRNGLGKNWKWLAFLCALFGMLACPGTGNLIQISSINQCVTAAFNAVNPATAEHNFMISLITGIIIAVLLAIIYFGGIKRIGRVTEKLVPFMAAIYILGAIIVILFNIENVIPTIKSIVIGAFAPEAVLGGTVGFTIKDAIRRGISRGVNSNEAGMGSAPLGHAAAETSHPVQQGMYGIVGVFMDTIVVWYYDSMFCSYERYRD